MLWWFKCVKILVQINNLIFLFTDNCFLNILLFHLLLQSIISSFIFCFNFLYKCLHNTGKNQLNSNEKEAHLNAHEINGCNHRIVAIHQIIHLAKDTIHKNWIENIVSSIHHIIKINVILVHQCRIVLKISRNRKIRVSERSTTLLHNAVPISKLCSTILVCVALPSSSKINLPFIHHTYIVNKHRLFSHTTSHVLWANKLVRAENGKDWQNKKQKNANIYEFGQSGN